MKNCWEAVLFIIKFILSNSSVLCLVCNWIDMCNNWLWLWSWSGINWFDNWINWFNNWINWFDNWWSWVIWSLNSGNRSCCGCSLLYLQLFLDHLIDKLINWYCIRWIIINSADTRINLMQVTFKWNVFMENVYSNIIAVWCISNIKWFAVCNIPLCCFWRILPIAGCLMSCENNRVGTSKKFD